MPKSDQFVKLIEERFPEDRLTYQKSIPTFHPESADEAAAFFRLANERKQPLYITGFGNNIDPVGESFARTVSVRTDRLNDLQAIEAEDFYVRLGAGYPLRELNPHLAERNLFAPHAALPYVGSVGGAIAVNLSCEHQGHALPIKRYLIQAEVVTPTGDIVKPGSVCFKSVSGYDIVKIYAQSWGLLGLIVSVTLRVFPLSAAEEYGSVRMEKIDRTDFLAGLDENCDDTDVIYNRKIKNHFDPNSILPVVG